MAELKPCPFCGCKDIRVMSDKEAIIERHRAVCFECSAQMYRGTPQKVIEAWNRRADDKDLFDAVEVVHGRWIDAREFCGDYICSNCESLYGTNKFNYCPNCGADMRGVEDGKETN